MSSRARHVHLFADPRSSRPPWMRALNGVGQLARPWLRFSADACWEKACAREPHAPAPTAEARAGLEALVASVNEHGALNPLGAFSGRTDTVRIARTHLRVEGIVRDRPEILDTKLPDPVFIVGLPRTGSTALHTLLGEDPRSRTIPYWESFDPVPPASGPDRRIEKLDKVLGQLETFAPDYHAIHPMGAEMAEECVALFMNHFRSLQFDFQYRIPGYVDWLLAQDARIAYEAYRRSLQVIQHFRPDGERLLVKDPTHLVHLETILDLWPDAKFIFTHRDPVVSLSSLCSLFAHTRAIFSDDVDAAAVGREVMAGYWPQALERSFELRGRIPAERCVDVRHPDLLRDPMGTVEAIHAGLGLGSLGDDAAIAMGHFLDRQAAKPRDIHEHSPEGFGLQPDAIRERFAVYRERFDLR